MFHTDPVLAQAEPFEDLLQTMQRGEVAVLVMLDTNPVYTAPGEAGFADLLSQVPLKLHAGLYHDETAIRCDWHLPLTHPLETWGDARALDGTATLLQPTIRPLYDGRSPTEILSLLHDAEPRAGYDMLRRFWRAQTQGADFEQVWRQALLAGFVEGSAFPLQQVTPSEAKPPSRSPPHRLGWTC